MKLTDYLGNDIIEINGKEYKLDLSFDNILRIYELKDDSTIDNYEKVKLMFDMLIYDSHKIFIPIKKKAKIVELILTDLMKDNEELEERFKDEENESEKDDEQNGGKIYDLEKDAELIYASFMMDYGIDLFEQQGKLHWKKFKALLNGLSEHTPFMKVIYIRTAKIPPENKYNREEVRRLRRLKAIYSLEKNTLNSGLEKAAAILKSFAIKKEGDKGIK